MSLLRNIISMLNPVHTDAGGRLRVANMSHVFEARFNYGDNPALARSYTTGGASIAHSADEAGFNMSVGTSSGDRAQRVTARYLPQPLGRSLILQMTGRFASSVSGVVSRIGWYDDEDGIFFEHTSTGMNLVLRSSLTGSVVEQRIPQSQWNVDKLDGSGKSKLTLNPSNMQVVSFASAFAGSGGFYAGFTIGKTPVTVHHFSCANISPTPLIRPVALPAQYEILNTSASAGATMFADGLAVFADGPYHTKQADSRHYYVDSGGSAISLSTSVWTPLMSVKLADLRNGMKFRGNLFVEEFNVLVNGTSPVMWQSVVNASLSGTPSWGTPGTAPGSSLLVDRDATGYSGGQPLKSGYFNGGASNQARSSNNVKQGDQIPLLSSVPYGDNDVITFGAKAMEAGTSIFFSNSYYETDD